MSVTIINADCRSALREMPADSVHCCVTSPPYFGLRSYLPDGHPNKPREIGLEPTPEEFVAAMVEVFRDVRRVLRPDGTLWLNLGDSYAGSGRGGNPTRESSTLQGSLDSQEASMIRRSRRGEIGATARDAAVTQRGSRLPAGLHEEQRQHGAIGRAWVPPPAGLKNKDLIGVPWMVAFALRADGWFLRSEIIWAKPNGMPGSQQDRCTSSHETIFLLSKSRTYWSDFDAIKTPPRESTLIRTAQDVQAQAGSHRANGGAKTNGPMKAVGGVDKQRGHSRRHAGFNERWDAMEKAEQQAKPAMMRDVWFVPPGGFDGAHFAVMPEEIARRCILAGSPEGGVVIDPFGGAGTVGVACERLGRDAVLIELSPDNVEMARQRIIAETSPSAIDRAKAKAAYISAADGPLFASIEGSAA